MLNPAIPKPVRVLVMLSVALLIASLLLTGVNAYVALASPFASPSVPTTVGFEGQLTDGAGAPVSNGNYTITFSLYSQATGGTAIWTETQTVAVSQGLYSVQLGSQTSLPTTAFDGSRWLGVKVGADSEMTPRVPISSVPYAINARQAMGLQGYDVAGTTPTTGNSLFWSGSAWTPRASTIADLAAVGSDASPSNLVSNYRRGLTLSGVDTANFRVAAGEAVIGGKLRQLASDLTSVGLASSLDTGSVTNNTQYYIYAVADGTGPSLTITSSTSATQPLGTTNFRKIGWIRTALDSTQIAVVANHGMNPGSGTYATIWKPRTNQLSNSTAETTIFSMTIPSGTLAYGNVVNLRLWDDIANNVGNTMTFRLKLGSTTLAVQTSNIPAGTMPGFLDVSIAASGASSQKGSIAYYFSYPGGGNWGGTASGTSTENPNTDLVLSVSAQFYAASTGATLDTQQGAIWASFWP